MTSGVTEACHVLVGFGGDQGLIVQFWPRFPVFWSETSTFEPAAPLSVTEWYKNHVSTDFR